MKKKKLEYTEEMLEDLKNHNFYLIGYNRHIYILVFFFNIYIKIIYEYETFKNITTI